MTGRLYIDGTDAYSAWGIFPVRGGYSGLAAMPKLKAVETNDWQEEDGIEADLESPVLDTRSFTVSLGVLDVDYGVDAFLAAVTDGAYHTWNFAEAGRTLKLRVTSFPALESLRILGTFSVGVSDDFPLADYEYAEPQSAMGFGSAGVSLDGTDLSAYGIRVLKGTLDSFRRPSDAKENMLRKISTEAGVIYDGESVTLKKRDVSVNCLMRAKTNAELWRNCDALLYNLSGSGERTLAVEALRGSFACYYSGMSVSEFVPALGGGSPAWLEFRLTLTLTTGSAAYIEALLASEAGAYVITEDGYCIMV